MGDPKPTARKDWGSSRVELRGTVARQPEMVCLPPEGRRFCELLVHSAGQTYRVIAYDKLAEGLRDTPAETRLKIIGQLEIHHWKTGQGKPRDRIVILAAEIERVEWN